MLTGSEILPALPSYAELYRLWERQHWGVHQLDYARDRERWQSGSEADRRRWLQLGFFAHFRISESLAVDGMAAYIDLMPREDQRVYLATQTADEARHVVFFDRFAREVFGARPDATGVAVEAWQASPSLRHLFAEAPQAALARARANPDDPFALAEAVTLSHIVLEGSLVMSTLRVVLHAFTREGGFPAFETGLKGLLRDECRHFLFGLRFVRDALQATPGLQAALTVFIDGLWPHLEQVLEVPPERQAVLASLGLDPLERRKLTVGALRRHFHTIGLSPALPACSGNARRRAG